MSGRKIGTLIVVVLRAKNLPNKRLIGKQDPYCVLKLGDQTLRTNAVKRGGQHPNWDEELRFPIYETAEEEPTKIEGKGDGDAPSPGLPPKDGAKATKRTMHLSCYAEDFLKPDLIGETTVDLTRALTKGEMDEYFTLMSKQRHCGEVYLEITYWSEGKRPPKQQAPQRSSLYPSYAEKATFIDGESPTGRIRFSTDLRPNGSPSTETNGRLSVGAWRKPRPDSPPIPHELLHSGSFENLNISIPPYGRDAASQGAATAYSDDPGHDSHHERSLRYDVIGRGASPSHYDEHASSLFRPEQPQSVPVFYAGRKTFGPRPLPPRPESLLESNVKGSVFGPRSPKTLTPPVHSHPSQSSHGDTTISIGTSFSLDQIPPFTGVPLPQDPYYPPTIVALNSQPTSAPYGSQQYPLPGKVFVRGQQSDVPPPSSTRFHEPPPGTVTQPSEGSTSSDSMIFTDDIGFAITWISHTPVKVNGHFCDVFEGIHVKAGKVALKRPRIGATGYDDVIIRRFEREAATWRELRHPHILEFLGTFKRDGHMYFVSPFISNGTLVEYIAEHPDINRIRLLCETADAVRYLHKEGVIHGDIKAGNILIDDNGNSLLCDFGLTKTAESRTSTAMRGAGTFRWQSPELWDNAPKSFESDVYAFGMTIAEVLTGEVPFHDLTNDMAVMYAVMLKDERPSKIPAESSSGISYENVWDVASACWVRTP